MIVVNKPSNFYWEYVCYFTQSNTGITIDYFNNTTLASVSINSEATGTATFEFSSSILTSNKTFVFCTLNELSTVVYTPRFYKTRLISSTTLRIYQYDSAGTLIDRFNGWVSVKIYP